MTDGDAILAAIRASPDDDTPRLLYADWLDDLMTPEATARAAFIRVECRLARDFAGTAAGCPTPIRAGHQTPAHGLRVGTVVGPCNACEACRERAGLWAAWRESQGPKEPGAFAANCWEWFARHLTWADHFTTARGFVERVTCPAADWLANADTILAAHPVRRARLTTADIGYADDGDDGLFGLEGDPAGKRWTAAEVMDYRLSHPQLMFADDIVTMLHMRWDGVSFEVPPFGTIVPGLSARGVMESAEEEAARHERLFDRFYEMGRRVGEARERAILDAVMGLTPATATIRGFLDPARPD